MPAPIVATYSVNVIEAAHQAFLDLIDAGTGAGTIKLRDNADVLLGTITLTDPAGSVDATTGDLTLTASGTSSAVASGDCTYGEVCDSDDNVLLSIPATAGTSPVVGQLVINSTDIVSGATITLVSATIAV